MLLTVIPPPPLRGRVWERGKRQAESLWLAPLPTGLWPVGLHFKGGGEELPEAA
jgi:hypothetical protein